MRTRTAEQLRVEGLSIINQSFDDHINAVNALRNRYTGDIYEISNVIASRLWDNEKQEQTPYKLLVCGNGGSAATAEHFAAELVGRYRKNRTPLACVSLAGNSPTSSCIGNDYGQRYIFSQPVIAHGRKGDVFLGLTTSGWSENIREAYEKAKERELTTILLLGKDGGKLANEGDYRIIVPETESTARIQEMHDFIMHCTCAILDDRMPELPELPKA